MSDVEEEEVVVVVVVVLVRPIDTLARLYDRVELMMR